MDRMLDHVARDGSASDARERRAQGPHRADLGILHLGPGAASSRRARAQEPRRADKIFTDLPPRAGEARGGARDPRLEAGGRARATGHVVVHGLAP